MEYIEIILIIGIILIQCYVYIITRNQIKNISNFLSSEDNIKLDQTTIDLNEENGSTREPTYEELPKKVYQGEITEEGEAFEHVNIKLSSDIKLGDKVVIENTYYTSREAFVEGIYKGTESLESAHSGQEVRIQVGCTTYKGDNMYKTAEQILPQSAIVNVSVIYLHKDEDSDLLRTVIRTINNYLRKNKGGAADFHLMKDIVERHCDSIDEEITHKLPVPIYLGLMGTVMGIIIGLFSLNFQFDPETQSLNGQLFVESVSGLINGVKLAMICSLVGLAMTTILSSWLYRGAKAMLEKQKNMLYDFIQTRLLPQMSKDAASTILTLQANLEKFNSSFEENIEGFGGIMDDIHKSFDSQVKLQKELKKMDISQVANLNTNVLAQLRSSMTEFEKFTQYLSQMNTFVRSTAKLTDSINDQLQRTEAVETIVEAMEGNIQKNQLVMEKLRVFLERVNEQQAVAQAAGEIDSAMSQAISELRSHTEEQIRSIKTYTTEATADLHELVTSERGHLKSLDKLNSLDKLVSAINAMKDDNHAVTSSLEEKISKLSTVVANDTRSAGGVTSMPTWVKIIFALIFVSVLFCAYELHSVASIFQQVDSNNQCNHTEYVDTTAVDTVAADTVW